MTTTETMLAMISLNLGNGAPMASSAQLCANDAARLLANGQYEDARNRAERGLSYLFGVEYARAVREAC